MSTDDIYAIIDSVQDVDEPLTPYYGRRGRGRRPRRYDDEEEEEDDDFELDIWAGFDEDIEGIDDDYEDAEDEDAEDEDEDAEDDDEDAEDEDGDEDLDDYETLLVDSQKNVQKPWWSVFFL